MCQWCYSLHALQTCAKVTKAADNTYHYFSYINPNWVFSIQKLFKGGRSIGHFQNETISIFCIQRGVFVSAKLRCSYWYNKEQSPSYYMKYLSQMSTNQQLINLTIICKDEYYYLILIQII